jgi:hypothetical protein
VFLVFLDQIRIDYNIIKEDNNKSIKKRLKNSIHECLESSWRVYKSY